MTGMKTYLEVAWLGHMLAADFALLFQFVSAVFVASDLRSYSRRAFLQSELARASVVGRSVQMSLGTIGTAWPSLAAIVQTPKFIAIVSKKVTFKFVRIFGIYVPLLLLVKPWIQELLLRSLCGLEALLPVS